MREPESREGEPRAAVSHRADRGGQGWRRGEVMPRWADKVQAELLRRRRRPGRHLRAWAGCFRRRASSTCSSSRAPTC
jgi:hypothetical protein